MSQANRFRRPPCIAIGILLVTSIWAHSASAQFVVAHRGASYDAPENTLAAFRLAWEQNADAVEGDFYLTSDGQIVCIHDRTTKRVAAGNVDLDVAGSTLEQLRKLDVGSWKGETYQGERIPTLKEVLATVPKQKRIFVEIKCGPEIVPELKSQLESSGLEDRQIVLICFNEAVVRECRRVMPKYKCNWLTGYKQPEDQTRWAPTLQSVLTSLTQTGATGLGSQANDQVIDSDFVRRIREAGFEFHVWTVNSPEAAKRYQMLGTDSITTDRPGMVRELISSTE